MSDPKNMAALLRIVAATMEGLSEKQYKCLLNGQATLQYFEEEEVNKPKPNPKPKPKEKAPAPAPIPAPVSRLAIDLHSRFLDLATEEEAYTLLSTTPKVTKDVLHELAGLLNVHVPKKTPKEQFVKAIVDSTIGSRLRTEALKKVDLGGRRK